MNGGDVRSGLGAVSDTIGARVRWTRERLGWSVEQLAEACEKVGAGQLTVPALYAVESGRRKAGRRTRNITADELLALAVAMGVHPVDLLVPLADDGELFAVAPNVTAPPGRVRDWLAGLGFLDEQATPLTLARAMQGAPEGRQKKLVELWMRQHGAEMNRAALAAERAELADMDPRGGTDGRPDQEDHAG